MVARHLSPCTWLAQHTSKMKIEMGRKVEVEVE
jgi:hypothetical protein